MLSHAIGGQYCYQYYFACELCTIEISGVNMVALTIVPKTISIEEILSEDGSIDRSAKSWHAT